MYKATSSMLQAEKNQARIPETHNSSKDKEEIKQQARRLSKRFK